jgi:hypothetical protein
VPCDAERASDNRLLIFRSAPVVLRLHGVAVQVLLRATGQVRRYGAEDSEHPCESDDRRRRAFRVLRLDRSEDDCTEEL